MAYAKALGWPLGSEVSRACTVSFGEKKDQWQLVYTHASVHWASMPLKQACFILTSLWSRATLKHTLGAGTKKKKWTQLKKEVSSDPAFLLVQ